jgi:hypothetical protein
MLPLPIEVPCCGGPPGAAPSAGGVGEVKDDRLDWMPEQEAISGDASRSPSADRRVAPPADFSDSCGPGMASLFFLSRVVLPGDRLAW